MAKRIMTVDDSPTIRQMISLTLRAAGYEVIEAADGREALCKLETEPIDMLVTDLNMPRFNGIQLVKEIRKQPLYRFMPIILLTSEENDDWKQEGKQVGASGWITKPFKPQQLLSVIRMVL